MLNRLLNLPRISNTATPESINFNLNDSDAWSKFIGGSTSQSGEAVTPRRALMIPAFWQAVDMIACDVASLPLHVYRRQPNDDREIENNHRVERAFRKPNDETHAYDFWQRLMVHALIWRNGYAYIGGIRTNGPIRFFNLLPDRTWTDYVDGRKFYFTEVDGKAEPMLPSEVLHIKGFSIDSSGGYGLLKAMQDIIGLRLSMTKFGSKFFANGMQVGGFLTVPPGFSPDSAEKLMEAIEKKHADSDKWFRAMVLRDGAQFQATTLDATKSQMNEQAEDLVREVARMFKLMPSRLGVRESIAYNSQAQDDLNYLKTALRHWLVEIKNETEFKLLTDQEKNEGEMYVDHVVEKLLQTDVLTTNVILGMQRDKMVINANEYRRVINRNGIGPEGDKYENPNTGSYAANAGGGVETDTGDGGKQAGKKADKQSKKASESTRQAVRELLINDTRRAYRRIETKLRSTMGDSDTLLKWIDSGLADQRLMLHDVLMPGVSVAVVSMGESASVVDSLNALSERILTDHADVLRVVVNTPGKLPLLIDAGVKTISANLAKLIDAWLNQWDE